METFDYFRDRLAKEYGADWPLLDERAARLTRLHVLSQTPEAQSFAASFPGLSEQQRAVLGALLES